MYSFPTLTIAAIAASAAAEAIHGGQFGEPVWAPAMAPRDNNCHALPKLCTDHVMLHGEAMTLTYLCPEKTQDPSTVHVTVTATTTVTMTPTPTSTLTSTSTSGAPAVPPKNAPPPEEPTTTTTVKSTLTQYRTITVISKTGSSSAQSLTPPVITTAFSEGIPPVLASSLTLTLPVGSGTTCNVSYTHIAANSSTIAPIPFYPNTTSQSGYAMPTLNIAREAKPTSAELTVSKSMSEQTGVSFVALFLGLMAAAYLA